tara:strand:+ start:79 stop:222 length:144 start_codon:yes stop_codon:yes gene_type:complete
MAEFSGTTDVESNIDIKCPKCKHKWTEFVSIPDCEVTIDVEPERSIY